MLLRPSRVLTRWQAAGLHLTASFALATLAAMLIFGVWYPQPYTHAAGADRLMLLLIGIDLALGPLLTLIVYQHGKKGMAFDIAFIATVQLGALVYGLAVISQSRPIFIVVSKDMTFLSSAGALADADLLEAKEAQYRSRSWTGPIQVAAPTPDTDEERQKLLESGVFGKDIERLPRYFRPMSEAGAALIEQSATLAKLAARPEAAAAVAALVEQSGQALEDLRFQPLRGRDPTKDSTIVYSTRSLTPVGVLAIDPWPALSPN